MLAGCLLAPVVCAFDVQREDPFQCLQEKKEAPASRQESGGFFSDNFGFKKKIYARFSYSGAEPNGGDTFAENVYSRKSVGFEMQRTAVARALIARPRILIADEPTGNLDKTNGDAIFRLFRKLFRDQGLTILITTHNLGLGCRADRVITLEDGKILKEEPGRARAEVAARAG